MSQSSDNDTLIRHNSEIRRESNDDETRKNVVFQNNIKPKPLRKSLKCFKMGLCQMLSI